MLFYTALLALCAGAMVRRQVDAGGLEAVQQGAWSDKDASVLEAVAGKLAAVASGAEHANLRAAASSAERAVRGALVASVGAAARAQLHDQVVDVLGQVTSPEWARAHGSLVTAPELRDLAMALLAGDQEGETEDTEAEQAAQAELFPGAGASLLNATEQWKPDFLDWTTAGRHWKDGFVPYCVSRVFNTWERKRIAQATKQWMDNVPGLRFEEVEVEIEEAKGMGSCKGHDQSVFVLRKDLGKCYSSLGKQSNNFDRLMGRARGQNLNLGNGCMGVGTIIHEFGHAIGMAHEQTRWDRDEYVTVHFDQIIQQNKHNFKKNWWTNTEGPYDYLSIMHYGGDAFSKHGSATISVKDASKTIGQRNGLSRGDIAKARRMYPAD